MSYLNVIWSPPFLWPGRAIQYFNVSITNKSDGSVTYHETNNNFGDRVVSFTKDIQEESLMCTEMTVNISAISNYSTAIALCSSHFRCLVPHADSCRRVS